MAQDLSLGALLLAADTLSYLPEDLVPRLHARADESLRQWQDERARQAAAIRAKATRELPHRLNLWRAYLEDLAEKAAEAPAYASEVRHRVIMERLMELLEDVPAEVARRHVLPLDDRLRQRAEPAPFVWAPALAGAYPPASYWFLYLRPALPLGAPSA